MGLLVCHKSLFHNYSCRFEGYFEKFISYIKLNCLCSVLHLTHPLPSSNAHAQLNITVQHAVNIGVISVNSFLTLSSKLYNVIFFFCVCLCVTAMPAAATQSH